MEKKTTEVRRKAGETLVWVTAFGLTGASAFNSLQLPAQAQSPQGKNQKKSGGQAHHQKLRLVSLAPSNTELLAALKAQDSLVGVCTYCDFPASVSQVTKAGTFVSANLEKLKSLHPDYVLLVSGQEALAATLDRNHFQTIMLENKKLEDIGKNILQLGRLLGKEEEATNLKTKLDKELAAFREENSKKSQTSVFYCVWPKPLMTVGSGSFLDEVITACGGRNIAGQIKNAYPTYSLEKLVMQNPDVIILPHEAKGQSFLKQAPWKDLKAVKESRVFFQPEPRNDMLARPTYRIMEGLNWLAERLHPQESIAAVRKQ